MKQNEMQMLEGTRLFVLCSDSACQRSPPFDPFFLSFITLFTTSVRVLFSLPLSSWVLPRPSHFFYNFNPDYPYDETQRYLGV